MERHRSSPPPSPRILALAAAVWFGTRAFVDAAQILAVPGVSLPRSLPGFEMGRTGMRSTDVALALAVLLGYGSIFSGVTYVLWTLGS